MVQQFVQREQLMREFSPEGNTLELPIAMPQFTKQRCDVTVGPGAGRDESAGSSPSLTPRVPRRSRLD